MEEGNQYSEYSVESNPRAYMTMMDYRNLAWQNQQPLGRNPNPNRSMRDYRDQWMSAPVYSVPSTYAPPVSPHFTSTPQPPQPPTPSPVEQAILNLSKLVDNFIEEQRAVTIQANQEIDTVESSLNKELDGFQSKIDNKLDILQQSISKLINQLVHQEEGNLGEEYLTDTTLGEQAQLQPQEELKEEPAEAPEEMQDAPQLCVVCGPWEKKEETSPLLTEEGSGIEAGKEPQKLTLQLIPMNLNPSATAQPQNSPLPVYILPTPAATSKPAALAPKAKSNPSLPAMQNFKRLVASVQNFATTSKTMAATHIAWHSGWFGCWF